MPKERIVAGIDIGSSKICTVISSVLEGKRSVIGVCSVPSRGLRRGVVVDIDEAVTAISQSLEGAERMAGCPVSSTFVSVNGSHVSSQNSRGVVAVSHPGEEIDAEDVSRVTEVAQAITLPTSREIIHVLPRDFIVDGQEGIKDPVGMSGIKLEVETNIITGSSTSLRNLAKCVQQVGVSVPENGIIYSALADAEAVLTDTEKELGTVLINIGGGTTSIIIYLEGSPAFSSVLPIGGKHVTNDLAIGLRTSLENAESIKFRLSEIAKSLNGVPVPVDLTSSKKELRNEIDVSEFGLDFNTVPVKFLHDITRVRMEEIFELVNSEIKRSGFEGMLPAGAVLTGGGSLTYKSVEIAKNELKLPVREGVPTGVTGLIEEIGGPASSTGVGLIIYGSGFSQSAKRSFSGKGKVRRFFGGIVDWFKSFLP
ncbi:cell division protein FtsA [candidate division WWE3 bacterium CG08_land_8_20_14_0_20_41_15]|uniref:Cell division protein FtsA n=1 Tax=candidate division WWE3 bacterium CG08_land_8_20_14_0_20_41_15 TaxID=1975086 RepID=A0A2H0XBU4_UNCKA|nr:MAG: cell division protein FtsA [candidate division WWE3 bacterium CG08_land_8_20_14_0_20_41_15]